MPVAQPHSAARIRTALGAVTFAALLLELSLTRLFSVVLFYHFAFLAISVALLGLGAGGVLAFLYRPALSRRDPSILTAAASIAAALLTVLALAVILNARVPLELTWATFAQLSIVYVASALPFLCVGLVLSVVFSRPGAAIPQLYAADLAGGALACLAVVPLLNLIGAPNAILCSALALAVAAILWTRNRALDLLATALVTVLLIVVILNHQGRWFDIRFAKGAARDHSKVEFARWNAISRVEVDREENGGKVIVIDADANTYIMGVDPKQWHGTEWERNLMSAVPSAVNVLRPDGHYAVIGPGGGVDVLRALANGNATVTGIEINPIITRDIMRELYAEYSKGLYLRPDVRIHTGDGRSYIRQTTEQFDVVQMTLVDTWASTAAGAFALSENNLYTVEAFLEYFAKLKPDGMLAITRWEFAHPREALRVVSNAVAALHRIGQSDPSMNLIVLSDGALNTDGRPVLVLAKKSPFTRDEEQRIFRHIRSHPNLSLIYSPHDRAESAGVPPVDSRARWNPFTALLVSNDPEGFAQKYRFDVSPVYDNAPFFFFNIKLKEIFSGAPGRGIDWKVNMGIAVLGIVLLLSLAAVTLFLVGPMALHAPARDVGVPALLYFVLVGLGYIVVEIAFIQRFVLFLGHPAYALTVVVFLMLLSSGLGSLVSRRFIAQPAGVWKTAAAIATAISFYAWAVPWLLNAVVGWPLAGKLVLACVLLVPLGFFMGMPFPTGLRALAGLPADRAAVEWAWALNAAASVLGSVLAIVIALQWGLVAATLAGASAYLAAALCSRVLASEPRASS
ncbi:MAG TPA: hypothetical protein VEG32_10805 [Clostridia bacterium]|nr:hypothetical protein [Clostridia bacterium]